MLYSYADYEEAYYHGRIDKCKQIGCYLLERKNDKRSKELLKELSKLEYKCWYNDNSSQEELNHQAKVLLEVKIWLMVSF